MAEKRLILMMVVAAKAIKNIQGGLVVVNHGEVIASSRNFALNFKMLSPVSVQRDQSCSQRARVQATTLTPFLTISFLSLPVIPELKLTDKVCFK